jgi:hypothetical protein
MKRRIGHHEREARIMAAMLPAVVSIGIVAGIVARLVPALLHR